MYKRSNVHRIVIGRAEELAFISQDITDVPAKVDTGAYRSAVHANDITLSTDGRQLTFNLLGGHPIFGSMSTPVTVKKFREVTISNSFGQEELRYEVSLRVKLGPKVLTTAFTLADRSKKIYPVLIGRKLLNNRFVVDSSLISVNRKALKKKFSIELPIDEEDEEEK